MGLRMEILLSLSVHILERQEMRAVSKNGHLLELTKINSKERHYVQFPHP